MKKRSSQSSLNSSKETLNKISSEIRHILLRHRLPNDFPLEQEFKNFVDFWKRIQGAPRDIDERLETYANERNWTDDPGKNFRIMSAIKDAWTSEFGGTDREHLIARKDAQGAWVYKYQCRKCGSVDERGISKMLSEYRYTHLAEDGTGMKKCLNCGEYTHFKKVRSRTQSWEMEKRLRKAARVQERTTDEIPISKDQFNERIEGLNAWNKDIAKRYEKIIADMFRKGIDETISALNQLWRDAKPHMERLCKPLGIRLCARVDCLRFLPQGSRSDRKYCSEQCKATEKSRQARRRERR